MPQKNVDTFQISQNDNAKNLSVQIKHGHLGIWKSTPHPVPLSSKKTPGLLVAC